MSRTPSLWPPRVRAECCRAFPALLVGRRAGSAAAQDVPAADAVQMAIGVDYPDAGAGLERAVAAQQPFAACAQAHTRRGGARHGGG